MADHDDLGRQVRIVWDDQMSQFTGSQVYDGVAKNPPAEDRGLRIMNDDLRIGNEERGTLYAAGRRSITLAAALGVLATESRCAHRLFNVLLSTFSAAHDSS